MAELIRRQYLVTKQNVSKLEKLSDKEAVSVTEIVRRAIDAYNPTDLDVEKESELMGLVSSRLQEAVAATRNANKAVGKTLEMLSEGDH